MTRTLVLALLITTNNNSLLAQSKEPDAEIAEKLQQLTNAIQGLKTNQHYPDVAIYQKAADWMIRHKEYEHKDAKKNLRQVLNNGLARAEALKQGKTPWLDLRGVPMIRGYVSQVDGSIQPYVVTIPDRPFVKSDAIQTELVLHGRDKTSTEVKFIAQHENQKPVTTDVALIEAYGRGNNAYRWAGETDIFECRNAAFVGINGWESLAEAALLTLRGFSMGGAGVWHLGLQHPMEWSVLMPGAGFTQTHGYIKNLPTKLPEYQEKCLTIYDAVRYAENAVNLITVAYSGGDDPQKQAADNIVSALKGFPLPMKFEHIVAPDLKHQIPPQWQAKVHDTAKQLMKQKIPANQVRFVTYTPRYNNFGEGQIYALEHQYEKAIIEYPFPHGDKGLQFIKTTNVRAFMLFVTFDISNSFKIDGQAITIPKVPLGTTIKFEKQDGAWTIVKEFDANIPLSKHRGTTDKYGLPAPVLEPVSLHGPIDDAFMNSFEVIGPTGVGRFPKVTQQAQADHAAFAHNWNKYFRGQLPEVEYKPILDRNLILFGDPASNIYIAKIIEKLPITWTKDKLIVNDIAYDPKTHMPILIYPNPLNPKKYVVINSGHTFTEADLKGTNANLYPHLGDWAIIKVGDKPEVVAAGLFNEFWQFQK